MLKDFSDANFSIYPELRQAKKRDWLVLPSAGGYWNKFDLDKLKMMIFKVQQIQM